MNRCDNTLFHLPGLQTRQIKYRISYKLLAGVCVCSVYYRLRGPRNSQEFRKGKSRGNLARTPDVAVVISLKLAYTPVDDTVTAPLCSTSTSINQTPAAGGGPCHGPQRSAFSGLWAIPSTESGPKPPLLVTYNLSSLALTPGEPTPYVRMYVSMVCGVYVGMCWVRRESTQVHREGGTVSSKGKKCSVCERTWIHHG
jgi:hypothetical protein